MQEEKYMKRIFSIIGLLLLNPYNASAQQLTTSTLIQAGDQNVTAGTTITDDDESYYRFEPIELDEPRTVSDVATTSFTNWQDMMGIPFSWTFARYQQYVPTIAIIDSGVNTQHVDFVPELFQEGFNFHNQSTDVRDSLGHGTAVAGLIGATIQNDMGIDGMIGSFAVHILPLRITNSMGGASIKGSVDAINYAVEKNVDIINLSFGGTQFSMLENEAIQRAIDAGIHVVAAAGNEAERGNPINYPASYANVLSVGAIDADFQRASFSNTNAYVDVVAPGQNLEVLTGTAQTKSLNGTSFSTPLVAATLAMMKSIMPTQTREAREKTLREGLVDLGEVGRDDEYGDGAVYMPRTLAHVFQENVLNQLQGNELIRNISTFPVKEVTNTHAIQVLFNEDLHESVAQHVHLFYNGQQTNIFNVAQQEKALIITPQTQWQDGMYTIVIDERLQNAAQLTLTESFSTTFIIQTQ